MKGNRKESGWHIGHLNYNRVLILLYSWLLIGSQFYIRQVPPSSSAFIVHLCIWALIIVACSVSVLNNLFPFFFPLSHFFYRNQRDLTCGIQAWDAPAWDLPLNQRDLCRTQISVGYLILLKGFQWLSLTFRVTASLPRHSPCLLWLLQYPPIRMSTTFFPALTHTRLLLPFTYSSSWSSGIFWATFLHCSFFELLYHLQTPAPSYSLNFPLCIICLSPSLDCWILRR